MSKHINFQGPFIIFLLLKQLQQSQWKLHYSYKKTTETLKTYNYTNYETIVTEKQ